MNITSSQHPAHMNVLLVLCVSSLFPVIPHAMRLPLWIPVFSVSLMLWRIAGPLSGWPLPGKNNRWLYLLQYGLSVIGIIGIYTHFGSLLGRDPGNGLLVMLLGLKMIETRQERDFYIVIFLGLILAVTNFFYSQSLLKAFYMFIVVIAQIATLLTINDHNQQLNWNIKLRFSATILLYSIPMMLVIFFLFPRIDEPLWSMPKETHTGKTGLNDTMTPGTISQLLQSDEIAFRVKFNNSVPDLKNMYWRGPVLWHTDGKTWTQNETIHYQHSPLKTVGGHAIHYEITQEASQKKWLFALEMPINPLIGRLTSDYQLLTQKPIQKRLRYSLTSYTEYHIPSSSNNELQMALQLPDSFHPKAKNLAQYWLNNGLDEKQIVDQALHYFTQEGFYYSLLAPPLTADTVDQFLFETQTGFCEHFSSAFVVLMRAAGIPARVVTGYQGASYNPVGNYYIVYQRDAHAWAEVWFHDTGWLRIDPTATVAPERILQGIGNALPQLEALSLTPFNLDQHSFTYLILRHIHHSWDTINNLWNQWVISYNAKRQMNLMLQLGFDRHDWKTLGIILFVSIALILSILMILIITRASIKKDPIQKYYEKFCWLMDKKNMTRLAHEGPADYRDRIINDTPERKDDIKNFVDEYIAMRYGTKPPDPGKLKKKLIELITHYFIR